MKRSIRIRVLAASALALIGLAACGGDESSSECPTITEGKLTIGTGTPAYYPWVADDAPESKQGFEAAVAYAVAGELGYADADVVWVRTGFDEAIQPGAKNFDFNLQQFSITEERKANVTFSDPYYSTNQALVGYADSAIAGATSIANLKDAKFGAQAGTTSLDFITKVIQPSTEPFVYDDNAAAKAALEAKQIDAIVVDLPTAFYISAVEIEGSAVIGQFPLSDAVGADNFGLVFDLDNPLAACVNEVLASLKESGKLAEIENEWLSGYTGAPVISLD
ncbi:MAG: amino acid ABC transporter substrate-binding protein [Actinobacteria bacterium]|nr:amino acid ABC transporter substrate-binding protein [Actinomycetota bacterium]NCX18243.1 amino acid ABC transporter substrate-binding protein [Acidimicrobiia bacterium]NCX31634.1 amino acid ABC transporter substrate-binding protein [Actinomycetota bacterium]NCX78752.1 amino acid ABC transporter substrate-binding protein [Actinomycetota bacterium]